MKTILRLTVLLSVLLSAASILILAGDRSAAAPGGQTSNDNKNKNRGRGSDDSNTSNQNSNSNSNSNNGSSGSSVSRDDARKAALAAVPGEIVSEEFESKRGRQIYEFSIRKSGDMYEVYVDASSGKVIKVEREHD